MGFTQGLAALGGGLAAGLLMPKPQIPAMPALPPAPTVIVPEQSTPINAPAPSPANAPLAPTSMSETAALRRARANRSISGGPSELVLSGTRNRSGDIASGGARGGGGGLVTRTSLLGR